MTENRVTRLAPSPTGALHLGNARTFLINWAMARQAGWRVVMRIEDLDTPRTKPDSDRMALDDLRWLGLDWDGEPTYQLNRLSDYQVHLRSLAERGLIYPCRCTRKEIENAQSAPQADEHELRYPGTCRPRKEEPARYEPDHEDVAWRLRVPDEPIAFTDELLGEQSFNVQQHVGDFVVATKKGLPAYQLAVVIDDALAGVTDIVRGDDLLRSTPRQLLIYRLLGLGPEPRYDHVPLVLGPDGRRLAKRHGDTRIGLYRELGVDPRRLIGLFAEWCGLGKRNPMTAAEFAERFDLYGLPLTDVVFTPDDDAWLRG